MNLQLFAAPSNMTGTSQFSTVSARDIDFVSSFSKNVQSLLDVLGITRMIKKANGTNLVVKTATGTLQSGSVSEGVKNISDIDEHAAKVIKTIKTMLRLCGFEPINRIEVRHKSTGRVYR